MASKGEFGKFILIEDSLDVCAKRILNFAIPDDAKHLHILCLEKSPQKWKSVFTNLTCTTYSNADDLLGLAFEHKIILLDSINQLAAQFASWSKTLEFLDKLNKNNLNKIIAIVHTDCLLFNNMLEHLRYMCQTCISLISMENAMKYVADIRNIHPGGKIVRCFNYVYFDKQSSRWKNIEIKKEAIKSVANKDNLIDTMTSFKIGVEKSAADVKRNLILPYTDAIKGTDNKVIADFEIDDWDDEDPDDDLNI